MATAGVDFFRVDRSGPTKRLLIVAAVLVTLGATSVGAHLVHRIESGLGHVISLVGGLAMLSGLVLGFGAMAMMLFENVYLLIGDEGVILHENGKETSIAWSDLEDVEAEASGFLILRRKDQDSVRWFAGKVAADIRAKVADSRRKALHGLLRSRG